jgi:uncharacterized protein
MSALAAALFVAGLASGLHCSGMCGGIAAGFTLMRKADLWRRQLAFNAGRITSYALGGAFAGALGSAAAYAAAALPVQTFLYFLAGAFALLVGVHLAGLGFPLARLEGIGMPLWRRLQPFAARLLPAQTLSQCYFAGLAWGWVPCGLVYGALAAAVFAGGVLEGAAAMAAFGLGTLPWLLAAGVLAARLRAAVKLRIAGGVLMIGLGGLGIAHAARGIAVYCF